MVEESMTTSPPLLVVPRNLTLLLWPRQPCRRSRARFAPPGSGLLALLASATPTHALADAHVVSACFTAGADSRAQTLPAGASLGFFPPFRRREIQRGITAFARNRRRNRVTGDVTRCTPVLKVRACTRAGGHVIVNSSGVTWNKCDVSRQFARPRRQEHGKCRDPRYCFDVLTDTRYFAGR